MWRDEQTSTNKEETEQTNKNSRFRNNRILVLFQVLVLLLQHPILVLVFKQKFCHSLARWLGSVYFFSSVFQRHLLGHLLPLWVWQFKFFCCSQVLELAL
jgi:hypothetical protein